MALAQGDTQMTSIEHPSRAAPSWLYAIALAGIGWNVFGLVQFAGAVTATEASLVASGMTTAAG